MPSVISGEFATAIASMDGYPAVVVADVAGTSFPHELLLANTEILGHVKIAKRETTFIADRSANHATLQTRVADALRDAGFLPHHHRHHGAFASNVGGAPAMFTGPDCAVMLSQQRASGEGTIVSVTVGPPIPAEPPEFRAHRHMMEEGPMPTLSPPSGVQQHQVGASRSGTSHLVSAVVIADRGSALDAAAVYAHHNAELVAQQWRPVGFDVGPTHAFASYMLERSGVEPYAGVYTVAQLADIAEASVQFGFHALRGRG